MTSYKIKAGMNMTKAMIRLVDVTLAVMLLTLSAPIIMLIATIRKLKLNAAFERIALLDQRQQAFYVYHLNIQHPARKLPELLQVITGKLHLLGSQQRFIFEKSTVVASKPGILCFNQVHIKMGLNFECQQQALINAHRNAISYLLAIFRLILINLFSGSATHLQCDSFRLFDVKISNVTMPSMIEQVMQATTDKQNLARFAFVNADCMNTAYHHHDYVTALNSCQSVFADGLGVRIAAQHLGLALKDNVNGTDMFPLLCEQLSLQGKSIFLLGGRPGIAQITAQNMSKRFPKLKIAGTHHGYLADSTLNASVIDKINDSGAAVLLVAMGAPMQELWLHTHQKQLQVGAAIGVGGLFDFYSNRIKRAPLWVRQIGMEWVCRLLAEPKRMWKRYIIGNPLFIYRVRRFHKQAEKAANTNATDIASTHLAHEKVQSMEQRLRNPELAHQKALLKRVSHKLALRVNSTAKRAVDITVATIALLLLSPLLLIVIALIRIESPGAVFFHQQRAGKHNLPFKMWKFRSMYVDAQARLEKLQQQNEMQGGVTFKMKKDPRITRIGRFIRKASIDELPQLWNVLKGDMSLVGPRPALLTEVEQYSQHERCRLNVKPGITCIWQVSGRSDIPFDKQVQLDIDYIYQQSLAADINLLLKTIPAVLTARGAY
ncbi:exopolysaccharide biosynthesis polyprenyl glycosylphosphotransferase [Shewanella waksmanii]|uniref:exopolysaccharide biosynthesis polyprenyl glycosylphosphotransferase n=1 Tax=Shewanella waksmanii TaxID=213783 RepID=UPI003735762E